MWNFTFMGEVTYMWPNPNFNPNANPNFSSNLNSNPNSNPDSNPNSNPHPQFNPDPNPNPDPVILTLTLNLGFLNRKIFPHIWEVSHM